MQEQEKMKEQELQQQAKNKEEQEKLLEKQMASMKLAYNKLDKEREKEEIKLMQSDPKKAQQLERLGMAVGTRGSGISHSAISDMQIIQQDNDTFSSNSSNKSSNFYSKKSEFLDETEETGYFSASKFGNGINRDNDDDFFKGFGACNTLLSSSLLSSILQL